MSPFDASLIPLAALVVGSMMALMILRIFGAVFSQAMAHYDLIISARTLRNSHNARLREIERVVQRETRARAQANAQRSALLHAPLAGAEEEVGVDVLEAA